MVAASTAKSQFYLVHTCFVWLYFTSILNNKSVSFRQRVVIDYLFLNLVILIFFGSDRIENATNKIKLPEFYSEVHVQRAVAVAYYV